ncbi:hypothetical protein [Aeromonas cavernicola]|uniref:hypothetical protein n=1 Tax=Aeromonas cavernicola TaxID=1006623 RepID=UPI0012FD8C4D|nr:hypothetical protein [Aeromonas cavernicola]
MQSINIHRGKALLLGGLLNVFSFGTLILFYREAYQAYLSVIYMEETVEINVVALWVPIGILGFCAFTLAGFFVSVLTGVKAHFVWGEKGFKFSEYLIGFFAVIGVCTAVFSYQWLTSRLDKAEYSYCKPLSKISAMGWHEVYVARPELCVKPSKFR